MGNNLENGYIVFQIKTKYSKEQYMCPFDKEKRNEWNRVLTAEMQAFLFLAEYCFCESYEIIDIRNASTDEIEKLNRLLEKHKDDENYSLWEAQTEVMYPEHNSINEQIIELTSKKDNQGKEMSNFYFTFGSSKDFPYQNTYLIVKATDIDSALKGYRKKYPDKNTGIVNCSMYYTQREWEGKISRYYDKRNPAEVIIYRNEHTKEILFEKIDRMIELYGRKDAGFHLEYEFGSIGFYQEDKRHSKIEYAKECINNCYNDNPITGYEKEINREIEKAVEKAECGAAHCLAKEIEKKEHMENENNEQNELQSMVRRRKSI